MWHPIVWLAGVRTAEGLSQPLSLPRARMLVACVLCHSQLWSLIHSLGVAWAGSLVGVVSRALGYCLGCTKEADVGPALSGGDPVQCPHPFVPWCFSSLNWFGATLKPLSTTEDGDLQNSPTRKLQCSDSNVNSSKSSHSGQGPCIRMAQGSVCQLTKRRKK